MLSSFEPLPRDSGAAVFGPAAPPTAGATGATASGVAGSAAGGGGGVKKRLPEPAVRPLPELPSEDLLSCRACSCLLIVPFPSFPLLPPCPCPSSFPASLSSASLHPLAALSFKFLLPVLLLLLGCLAREDEDCGVLM